MADDGDHSGVAVEAGELGTVTATSDVYDTRLAAAKGCDPEGCTADLTRVRLWRLSHVILLPILASATGGGGSFFCCAPDKRNTRQIRHQPALEVQHPCGQRFGETSCFSSLGGDDVS